MTLALFLLAPTAYTQELETPEDLRAVLTFRDEQLTIREEHEVIPGRVILLGSSGGPGPGAWSGYTWSNAEVASTPAAVLHSWAVYRGPERLTVPDFLEAIDRRSEAERLETRVRRNASIGRVFGGLALVGLAAGVGGFVGTVADDPAREPTWTAVALGGLGGTVLSGIVSGATRSRSDKLAHDFPETQDLASTQEEVREYDEELREDLGLSPTQAWRELEGPPQARR